ncbi:RadC family protein [Gluconobacter kanchanaburiensis]|uniref:DNA repair protein RadC n=1 Tax=Gluconobacter kanchanaburiensis NBRC 103587 TaxID=1307948 RepID=A0A511B9W1_9PROT|nr:DNA repair protein RadC [Gluconobacter kanchanaburiensis]MBF0861318.1 DNA repair protein RadC [Gluconobacter kanchanaburiensis]GBR71083.1 DNA repair protein RadC [Gluconobacter kanchanaburiensis NBRC 103587]GEK97218.1 DNA repair protein RadC [Gluconobacter kanchanaburiensis NBRC 103587]
MTDENRADSGFCDGMTGLSSADLRQIVGIPASSSEMEPPLALLTGRGRHLGDETLLRLLTVLFTHREEESAVLSRTLFARFGSLAAVLSATDRELESVADMGMHMIPLIRVVQEAALRYNRARLDIKDVLDNEQKLLDYLTARLARENIEQFRILFLDKKNSLIADEAQARGTVNHTPVYPREVARRAVEIGATALVLVHNHPSGDPTPSEADLQMTMQVQAALDVVGIALADHFIIGNGRHTSFRRSKLI